jgi:hypothetical protein
MRLRRTAIVIFLTLVFAAVAHADIPPPQGYTRVSVGITLEAKDDVSDYRFFVVSGNLAKELFIKQGEKTRAGSLGGGARYNSGEIVAIPKKSLASFGDDLSGDKLAALETAVADAKVAGSVTLVKHSFTREVRDADAKSVADEGYRIERSATGLTAVPVSSPVSNGANAPLSSNVTQLGQSQSGLGWTSVMGGLLMTLAFFALGLWIFLKFIKKSA